MFKLRGQLYGHRGDVRALACFDAALSASLCADSASIGAESILSGSRDKTACIWSLNGSEGKVIRTLRSHTEFVNTLCVVPNSPDGLLVFTGSGKTIRAFAPLEAQDPELPRFSLEGHEKEVCFLSTTGSRGSDGLLLSGSWDHTARVWDLKRRSTLLKLTGHSKSVWVVRQMSIGQSGGLVLTGSADCSIKGWRAGRCVFTLVGHTDCVRDLLAIESLSLLVSASNDATLRIWRLGLEERECACVRVLPGHESYIYSLALVSPVGPASGVLELASVGEDRALKLWRVPLDEIHSAANLPGGAPFEDYRACGQTLVHPAISVWCVVALPNGDLATGASDGVIRLFTRDPSRTAPADVQASFQEAVKKSAVPAQALGDNVDVKKLPGVEALLVDGTKEGEYRMVRDEEGKGQLYTWSMAEQSWQLVGEIVGQKEKGAERKPLVDRDGRPFECVYDVTFDMPELAGTRIGWHPGDNPYEVAQSFIYEHDIPQDNLDVIAQFVIRNTPENMASTAAAAGQTLVTGFTIPDRYVPSSSGGAAAAGGAPLTTGFTVPDRYVPPSFSTPMTSSPIAPSSFFPQQELVFFAAGSPDSMLRKIAEFNGQTEATARLSEGALNGLAALHSTTEASASVTAALHALEWLIAEWPLANLFPALDLLRLSLMGPRARTVSDWLFQSSEVVQQAPIDRLFSRALLDASHSATTQAMAMRVLCNAFASEAGIAYILRSRDLLSSFLGMLIDERPERLLESRHLALATVTALLDMAVLLARFGPSGGVAVQSVSIAGEERVRLQLGLLEACAKLGNVQPSVAATATTLDAETALRLLVAVGTLATSLLQAEPTRRVHIASVVQLDRLARVTASRAPNAPDNLRLCLQDIERLLS